jgi:hypothetical protein
LAADLGPLFFMPSSTSFVREPRLPCQSLLVQSPTFAAAFSGTAIPRGHTWGHSSIGQILHVKGTDALAGSTWGAGRPGALKLYAALLSATYRELPGAPRRVPAGAFLFNLI